MTTDTETPPAAGETPSLETLRAAAEASASQADEDRTALLEAAVKTAMESTAYGTLSRVAREAGITSQYLRDLIEAARPGWLEYAAEQREAAKGRPAKKKTGTSGATPRKRASTRKTAPKRSADRGSAAA